MPHEIQFSLLDEIQNTKKMNTRELKERKFEKEVGAIGWIVLIFIRHFFKHFSTAGKRYQKLNLESSYETQTLYVFFLFVFEKSLKGFPFYLPILLTLWLHPWGKLFFKIPQQSADLNSNNFPFGVHHEPTPRSHWTK